MIHALHHHWPEYLMEAAELGIFMVSAILFTVLFQYAGSPVSQALSNSVVRRSALGFALGLTAIAIIYSPWGRQSGAHFNPSVTLAFFRLGKVEPGDAFWYPVAQLFGGLAGVLLSAVLLGAVVRDRSVDYAVTVPGPWGASAAFLAELLISFGLMMSILISTNDRRLHPFTGLAVGVLIALFISVESPLSGTSMNAARTVASALPAGQWSGIWVYLTAPLAGMLGAAEVFARWPGRRAVRSAKLFHDDSKRCIFKCDRHWGKPKQASPAIVEGGRDGKRQAL